MSSRNTPIYSTFEEDPELLDAINAFVVALAERIDGLQDLHSAGELARLGELCAELSGQAQRLGYPLMASLANVASEASRENKADASEQALIEMTELTLRIRKAHRGSA
jgi:hypothetical protein